MLQLLLTQWVDGYELGLILRILALLYCLTIAASVLMVILDRRNPTKTLLWVWVLILLPIMGLVFYIFLGQNLRRRLTARRYPDSRREVEDRFGTATIPLSEIPPQHDVLETHAYIATLLDHQGEAPVLGSNGVELYHEGEVAFASLLEDIRHAQDFIHMEYYTFTDDALGQRIAAELIERAGQGVDVRIIYDAVGSWGLSKSLLARLQEGGVRIYPFERVIFPLLGNRINNRNHRKIVVIDGTMAYMGGMNIAQRYITGSSIGQWVDTQLRIKGPAAHALHRIFLRDWAYVSGEAPSPDYCPIPVEGGNTPVQIITSAPEDPYSTPLHAFITAIARAKRYIYICTPYFIPSDSLLMALRTTALSGVDVRIILPRRGDAKLVLWAIHSYIEDLLESGIRVYLYTGGFNHSKTLIVDGELAIVGSANMDIRSFEENYEVLALLYDRDITRRLELEFIGNTRKSHDLDLAEWRQRPLARRGLEAIARLFSPVF
ncbi:MAG: cardiolipin synthase [Bacteroidia bacterium]|nr:MAG: cardiolipin synthase [Bacteroidia bacterium]